MNTMRTCLAAAAGLIILTLSLTFTGSGSAFAQGMKPLLVQVMNTSAEPIPVTPVVPAADRVMLEYHGGGNEPCSVGTFPVSRIFPDGTSTPAFSVPAGKMLVLTDLEGIIRQDPGLLWTVGLVGDLAAIQNTPFPKPTLRAFAPLTSEAVSGEMVSMGVHLQSGVVMGPNVTVCVVATVIFPNGGGVADVVRALLQGYLIAG